MIDFGVTEKKLTELRVRMEKSGIKEGDLQEKFIRSCGHGGQHVNKTSTCVLLVHIPTGMQVKMQKARTQRLNRYYSRKRLCELIEDKELGNKSPGAIKAEKIRKQKQRRKRRSHKSD